MAYRDSKYTEHAFVVEVLYDDPLQGPTWIMAGQGDEFFNSVDAALEYAKASLTEYISKARVVQMTTVTETTFAPEPETVVEGEGHPTSLLAGRIILVSNPQIPPS